MERSLAAVAPPVTVVDAAPVATASDTQAKRVAMQPARRRQHLRSRAGLRHWKR